MAAVEMSRRDSILVVTINRPESRNAVDAATATALAGAFRQFDGDTTLDVAVLTGAGGNFCAGADLKAIASGRPNPLSEGGDGPMGPTRLLLSKPVIAAIEGYAVAGGFELPSGAICEWWRGMPRWGSIAGASVCH
jgi:enoyl-CoA hydratase